MKFFKANTLFLLLPGLFIFAYIALRANILSFTHDECLSYNVVLGNLWWKDTANHHILNTFLMSCCNTFFGNSEISLRLPNILAFILYFTACFCIIKFEKSKIAYILACALLLFNPFLLDFFSLARGYGLSVGFMMISLYFLLKNSISLLSEKHFLSNVALSLLFGCFAFFSNLVLINYYIACIAIFSFLFVIKRNKISKYKFISIIGISLVPLFFGLKRLIFLSSKKELYFGEDTLYASLNSLVNSSLYHNNDPSDLVEIISCSILVLIVFAILSIIIKRDFFGKFALLTLLIMVIIGGNIFEHVFFSALYPSERTAISFIPLLGLFVYYLILHVKQFYSVGRKLYIPIVIFVCILMIFNFYSAANLSYVNTWKYDMHTKEVMKHIELETKNLNRKAFMSNYWIYEPSINYYITTRNLNVNFVKRSIRPKSDYIYSLEGELQIPDSEKFVLVKRFEDISTVLVKKSDK